MSTRSVARIAFDPREERVISDLARWMGRLGRFQIVGAVFIFVALLAVTGIITTVEVIEPVAAGGQAPLVSVGEISRGAIAALVVCVVAFSLIFLRGGMILLGAAEDLETVVGTDELDQHHLEGALQKLRNYFVLESIFMLALAAAAYAATIAGWGL